MNDITTMKLIVTKMWWGDPEHTVVGLDAESETGQKMKIGTPYDETSQIWELIKQYPVDQIEEYVEPTPPEPDQQLAAVLQSLTPEQKQNLINSLQAGL